MLRAFLATAAVSALVSCAHAPSPKLADDAPPLQDTVTAEPVTIEEADKILRARSSAPRGRTGAPDKRASDEMRLQGAEALLLGASECGASSQPVEIRALAASLKCDVDLIFEHVYNNIEYEPLFGSNKGALGTLLDQRGNDIDQVNLFKALLDAAGYSSSRINLQYGYIRVNGTTASSWLGVTNDGNAILQLLANGGIPTRNFSKNGDGTLASLDVAHVWAQVQIAGTFYVFDPSFKLHSASTGIANLASALGYSQSALLSISTPRPGSVNEKKRGCAIR
ncbi:MAG: hypothetical protein IT530_20705 [Burkholderiales bacterium]|nr:hypothetical protein [Burkholderiales bacterium]